MVTRSHVLILASAAFSLFAVDVFAQQPAPDSSGAAGSGAVATAPAPANPEANPVVPGDNSTIRGDSKATTEQKTGQE
jgi:hypothetical protein